MSPEEYAEAQAKIVAGMLEQLTRLIGLLLPPFTPSDWPLIIKLLFPIVDSARVQSAALGRAFYDAQREDHAPGRHDQFLEHYEESWFNEAMVPEFESFVEEGLTPEVVTRLALRASKEVESGGRRQIMHAVENDDPEVVEGWARVATGKETCEFCLTMISRGPVYRSAKKAGVKLENAAAVKLWKNGGPEAFRELMTKWHTGCDCLVVPVFDVENWAGMEEAEKALNIWNKYTKLVVRDPKLQKPLNGNQHQKNPEWTRNKAIMAAIRRALYNGDIDMRDFGISTRDWRAAA